MMTRMERATATWALALPRRRAIRWCRSPRKVAVRAAPLAAWVRAPRSQVSPWPFLPARVRGPDWRAEGHNPAQDTKWAAVGNRVPFNTQVRQTPLAANASGKLPQNGRPVTRGEVMMCADLRLGRSS